MKVLLCDIRTDRWRRAVNLAQVSILADSIKQVGLLNPVTITEGNELIAGMHRVEACRKLGYSHIEATIASLDDVHAEIASIDENIIRNEPDYIARGEMLARRKRLYEALHPETRRGVAGAMAAHGLKSATPESGVATSFVEDVSSSTGISKSSIKEEIQIAENVLPELKEAIQAEEAPKREALKIARMEPLEQALVLDAVQDGDTIKEAIKKTAPHVANNSGNNEWYTPSEYIDVARAVMGGIDTDPASSEIANRTVQAGKYYTKDDDGLSKPWAGRVWMNPPYAQPLITQFCETMAGKYEANEISEAMVLVNNGTETKWFHRLLDVASAVCLLKGRVRYIDQEGNPSGAPLQGQCLIYIGKRVKEFSTECEKMGRVLTA